jgi:hypothetical protein
MLTLLRAHVAIHADFDKSCNVDVMCFIGVSWVYLCVIATLCVMGMGSCANLLDPPPPKQK